MSIRTILCPIDFSPTAEDALRYAVSLAPRLGAQSIHVLHVHQSPALALAEGSTPAHRLWAAEVERRDARELEAIAKRYSAHDVAVVPSMCQGVPYEQIVRKAEAIGADLIVLGTHGRSGLRRWVLGSVAERVLRSSPVPVCTVRGRG